MLAAVKHSWLHFQQSSINSFGDTMANIQQGQPIQSGEQNPSSGSMLGGVTDKMSSAVNGGQGGGDDQSYLSKGEWTTS